MINNLQWITGKTKVSLIAAILVTFYGYLCRIIGIYFFWESISVGWTLILISLILLLYDRIRIKKLQNKKKLIEKIGIGIILFVLIIRFVFLIVIPKTDAFNAAKQFISASEQIAREIGSIKGFGVIPSGNISVSTSEEGEIGNAEINLTVKGARKYKDFTVYLEKNPLSEWQVKSIQ
jgi:hypothetical protein